MKKLLRVLPLGLISLHEYVTWEAKHFGIVQRLSTKIVEFNSPGFFADEMTESIFKSMRHEHHFTDTGQGTKMTDIFNYESPLGWCGKLADYLFLKRYMTDLLIKRNDVIKSFAEGNEWMKIVNTGKRTT